MDNLQHALEQNNQLHRALAAANARAHAAEQARDRAVADLAAAQRGMRDRAVEAARQRLRSIGAQPGLIGTVLDAIHMVEVAPPSPPVESTAPPTAPWRKEPPTVEEVRNGQFRWWFHGRRAFAQGSGPHFVDLRFNADEDALLADNRPLSDCEEGGEWAPCLPPSSPPVEAVGAREGKEPKNAP